MAETTYACTRRAVLTAVVAGGAGLAGAASAEPPEPGKEVADLVKQLTGRTAAESDRVQLIMPRDFANAFTVPLTLVIDSPMTESEHVRWVRVFAPRNPIVEVARFDFTPGRMSARASTRIRLAKSQHVVAVADMSDGSLLMATAWVEVAADGCS